ncbi:MAG: hypothetical protein JRF37_04715, partial [Deltaproteobacteria bacterium]|nr:hypothetical protein [Deltaproteobacteria bacterium]
GPDSSHDWTYGENETIGDEITDIWDALRVNEGIGAPNVGSNVLEIAIDEGANYFSQPINVVYIPMSRMLWKDSGESPQPPM